MRFGPFALPALLLPVSLPAHPHARVDQQAHLSIGRTEAVVTYHLTPSTTNGGHMFDRLDADGDERLSRAERSAFAAALVARSRLSVDGSPRRLTVTHVVSPERRVLAAGGGIIKVRTSARLSLEPGAKHRIIFDVMYDRFGMSWFIQPHYAPYLMKARARPAVRRRSGSNAVMIAL